MNEPKLHHYVPRFYLSGFTDNKQLLWAYDKFKDKIFQTKANNIAGKNKFYLLYELIKDGLDPLTLEKQFADLEYQVSNIINCWFNQIKNSKKIIIPQVNREIISLYLTTQLLRTMEAREILIQLTNHNIKNYDARSDANSLHAALLWDDEFINEIKNRVSECIWIFGYNNSNTSFYTSDHPVLIKTHDNKQWLLGPRVFEPGMYIVFPLSPKLIMYCKDPEHWGKLKIFENSISPVEFNSDMVKHENSGQIGMSYRFIFSIQNDFDFAKLFLSENKEFSNPSRSRFFLDKF